jgi:hypothetical protein
LLSPLWICKKFNKVGIKDESSVSVSLVPVETHFTAFYTNGATSKPRREEEQIIL